MADAHFLVLVVESTPFGEYFGLLVFVLGQGGEPGSDRVAVSTVTLSGANLLKNIFPIKLPKISILLTQLKNQNF